MLISIMIMRFLIIVLTKQAVYDTIKCENSLF